MSQGNEASDLDRGVGSLGRCQSLTSSPSTAAFSPPPSVLSNSSPMTSSPSPSVPPPPVEETKASNSIKSTSITHSTASRVVGPTSTSTATHHTAEACNSGSIHLIDNDHDRLSEPQYNKYPPAESLPPSNFLTASNQYRYGGSHPSSYLHYPHHRNVTPAHPSYLHQFDLNEATTRHSHYRQFSQSSGVLAKALRSNNLHDHHRHPMVEGLSGGGVDNGDCAFDGVIVGGDPANDDTRRGHSSRSTFREVIHHSERDQPRKRLSFSALSSDQLSPSTFSATTHPSSSPSASFVPSNHPSPPLSSPSALLPSLPARFVQSSIPLSCSLSFLESKDYDEKFYNLALHTTHLFRSEANRQNHLVHALIDRLLTKLYVLPKHKRGRRLRRIITKIAKKGRMKMEVSKLKEDRSGFCPFSTALSSSSSHGDKKSERAESMFLRNNRLQFLLRLIIFHYQSRLHANGRANFSSCTFDSDPCGAQLGHRRPTFVGPHHFDHLSYRHHGCHSHDRYNGHPYNHQLQSLYLGARSNAQNPTDSYHLHPHYASLGYHERHHISTVSSPKLSPVVPSASGTSCFSSSTLFARADATQSSSDFESMHVSNKAKTAITTDSHLYSAPPSWPLPHPPLQPPSTHSLPSSYSYMNFFPPPIQPPYHYYGDASRQASRWPYYRRHWSHRDSSELSYSSLSSQSPSPSSRSPSTSTSSRERGKRHKKWMKRRVEREKVHLLRGRRDVSGKRRSNGMTEEKADGRKSIVGGTLGHVSSTSIADSTSPVSLLKGVIGRFVSSLRGIPLSLNGRESEEGEANEREESEEDRDEEHRGISREEVRGMGRGGRGRSNKTFTGNMRREAEGECIGSHVEEKVRRKKEGRIMCGREKKRSGWRDDFSEGSSGSDNDDDAVDTQTSNISVVFCGDNSNQRRAEKIVAHEDDGGRRGRRGRRGRSAGEKSRREETKGLEREQAGPGGKKASPKIASSRRRERCLTETKRSRNDLLTSDSRIVDYCTDEKDMNRTSDSDGACTVSKDEDQEGDGAAEEEQDRSAQDRAQRGGGGDGEDEEERGFNPGHYAFYIKVILLLLYLDAPVGFYFALLGWLVMDLLSRFLPERMNFTQWILRMVASAAANRENERVPLDELLIILRNERRELHERRLREAERRRMQIEMREPSASAAMMSAASYTSETALSAPSADHACTNSENANAEASAMEANGRDERRRRRRERRQRVEVEARREQRRGPGINSTAGVGAPAYYERFLYQSFYSFFMSFLPWWGPDRKFIDPPEEDSEENLGHKTTYDSDGDTDNDDDQNPGNKDLVGGDGSTSSRIPQIEGDGKATASTSISTANSNEGISSTRAGPNGGSGITEIPSVSPITSPPPPSSPPSSPPPSNH